MFCVGLQIIKEWQADEQKAEVLGHVAAFVEAHQEYQCEGQTDRPRLSNAYGA